MRIIFMGAPDFATPTLRALIESEHEVVAVYTRAPRPAGRRGLEVTRTPVHEVAQAHGLPVVTPSTLRDPQTQAEFRAFGADVAIVAAYGLILPLAVLAAPTFGCLNVHGSLLPRWRGAAPVQRAIMAGDGETGVDLMRMEEGLDTGPVARESRTPIHASDTAGDLTARLAKLGAELVVDALPDLAAGRLEFRAQASVGAAYARKIEKGEAPIDWQADAVHVRNHVHGLSPSPGAYGEIGWAGEMERIKILRASVVDASGPPGAILDPDMTIACGAGAIRVIEAQRAGKSVMSGVDLMRGGKVGPGARFRPRSSLPAAR